MIHQSHDGTTLSRPRLLPWSNLDGNPCYLLSDGTGSSHLSRVADNVESVQLDMAEELLDHAADLLGDGKGEGEGKTTAHQLRFLAARLTEALHDVHRIARSRGARLPVPDGDDDDPADAESQTSAGQ
ncbi:MULTISPECIES: hypothetical protein [unclassified Streptomyces]|uniref:hypothetical protein n=1 Tax=unclassified Streptomyces TaxID=2593676 RepID=UPI002DD93A21|nr:hypothetical protein [Streptomyces sp. NBC_01445]WSE06991.1 hypothetical protein OG574_28850 [Streptomyces sp. NBC_01445]